MKKILFVAGFITLSTLVTNAQSTRLGLKAGLNVASLNVSDGNNFSSKAGLNVGGLAHIHIDRNWAVQPELVYSMQGGERGNVTSKLDYLNIPVLLQYMTNSGFRVEAGPQLGFLVSAKNTANKVTIDVKDQLTTADVGVALGAGYLSKSGLGVDARYNFGLTNISKTASPTVKNMVFQVGAFYQFNH